MVKTGIINASAWISFPPCPVFQADPKDLMESNLCINKSSKASTASLPLCRGDLGPEPASLPNNRPRGRYRWISRWTNHNASLNALMSGEENKSSCIAVNQWAFNLVFVTPITIPGRDQTSVVQPWRPHSPPLGFGLFLALIGQPDTLTACDSIQCHSQLPAIRQEKLYLFGETNYAILQKRFALAVEHTLSCNIGVISQFQSYRKSKYSHMVGQINPSLFFVRSSQFSWKYMGSD